MDKLKFGGKGILVVAGVAILLYLGAQIENRIRDRDRAKTEMQDVLREQETLRNVTIPKAVKEATKEEKEGEKWGNILYH